MPKRNRASTAALAAAAFLIIPLSAFAEEPGAPAPASGALRTVGLLALQAEIQRVEQRLVGVSQRLDFVNREYTVPQPAGDPQRFERRVARAESLILLKDYTSAAVMLFELLEEPANKANAGYYEAVEMLANTLFLDKNHFGARVYYKRLLEQGGKKFFQSALKRLVEIAAETGNYEGLETYFSLIKQADSGSIASDVYYLLGRSLYLRGDLTRALEVFQLAAEGSTQFFQARYFMGAILVKKNRFADAMALYEDIIRRNPQAPAHRLIVDLAYLATGRLYYEQGKFTEATNAYQKVDRRSDLFDDAMYELAWINIKTGEMDNALRILDILLLSSREVPVIIQARVLRGNILLKMGKYEDAVESFQTIVDRYAPIRENLQALLDQHDDPAAYFEKLLGEGLARVETAQALPEVVVKWASMDKQVSKAIAVVKDLEASRKSLEDAFKIFSKLLMTLDGENRINMFPLFKEAKIKGLEVKGELDLIRRELVDIEDAVITGRLVPTERTASAAAASPKLGPAETAASARKLQELEQVAYKFGVDIDSLRADLMHVEKWFNDQVAKGVIDPSARKAFNHEIKLGYGAVSDLAGALRDVLVAIERERSALGIAPPSDGQLEKVLRARNAVEEIIQASRPSQNELEELRWAREQRDRLEKLIALMPKSQDGYQVRSVAFATRLQELSQGAFGMSVDIDGIRAQLTAIDKWFFESSDRRSGEPELEKKFVQRIRQEWTGLDELSAELKEVLATIDTEKQQMGLASDMSQDEKIRQQYREALETERKVLDRLRKKLPGDALVLVERIDAIRVRVNQYYTDIDRLSAHLDKAMLAKAVDLRERVLAEKKLLESYNGDATSVRQDTENLVGRIAYNGFRQAHRKFYDLVMQADVGIIDVVWKQKEEQRANILKIQSDLDKEMKAITDEFSSETAGQ